MRHDPIEIAVLDGSQTRRRGRRKRRPLAPALPTNERRVVRSDALDEAFADLPAATATTPDEKRSLFGQLAAQVVEIDRHCQRLSQVIKNLDADHVSRQ